MISGRIEGKDLVMSEEQAMELVKEILNQIILNNAEQAPRRTQTANKILNNTLLQIEAKYASRH